MKMASVRRKVDWVATKRVTVEKNDAFLSKYQKVKSELCSRLDPIRLALVITKNRRTMISVKREIGMYRVRIHEIFLDVDDVLMKALVDFVVSNQKEAKDALENFIESHRIKQEGSVLRKESMFDCHTKGEVHHLQEIYEEMNQRYFDNRIRAHITWGKRLSSRRSQRSIRMGSYSVEERMIRIHPSLDRSFVPRYFVAWVVYHEMLHQKHDIKVVNGRRQFHSKYFLADERMFEEYERAKQWESLHVGRLLLY